MSKRVIMIMSLVMLSVMVVGFSGMGQAATAPQKPLLVAVGMEPSSLDPSLTGAGGGGDYAVVQNWGEYLIQKMPNGDLKPGLVTSWKVSPDGKMMEFVLRKGVKFHSRDPLTASDVKFSFERAREKNPTARTRLSLLEKFEIIDDYRFKLHFRSPDVTFIPLQAAVMIVSQRYYERVGEEQFSKQPSSTGPYKVVRYLSGEQVDLERFEDYWGKKPPLKQACIFFIPEDTTRMAKLKAGEVDFINSVPWPLVADLEKSREIKTVRLAAGHPTRGVVFSTLNPKVPWADKRVRQAMAYAIDCQAIIKNLLGGIPNHWPWIAPGEIGYDPSIKPYPYDPQKAKQLLAEAGYPNGFDFNFYWPISGRIPMTREICEAIASYLEAVGIRTKLIGQEAVAFVASRRAANKDRTEYASYFTTGFAGAPDPAYNLERQFTKTGDASTYYNPEIEEISAQAMAEMNNAKRAVLIKKAIKILREDVAAIPIFNNVYVFAMKKNVNFSPTLKHNMDLILIKDITIK
jgi:peptide/nickel transport system substrate-binding protein